MRSDELRPLPLREATAARRRSWPGRPRLPLTFLAIALVACGTGDTSGRSRTGDASFDLEADMRELLDGLPARTSAYAKHLPTGREAGVRPDQPMDGLSLVKIPIVIRALRDAEAGRLALDQRRRITADAMRIGSGVLRLLEPGLEPSYRDLVGLMLVFSDNTANDVLLEAVQPDRVNRMLAELGFRHTRLNHSIAAMTRRLWTRRAPREDPLTDRQLFEAGFPDDSGAEERGFAMHADSADWEAPTTAREMGLLLERLYLGELLSEEHTRDVLRLLRSNDRGIRLRRDLETAVPVAHKGGAWEPYAVNSAGLLFHSGGPTVLIVMVNQNRGNRFEPEDGITKIAADVVKAWGR